MSNDTKLATDQLYPLVAIRQMTNSPAGKNFSPIGRAISLKAVRTALAKDNLIIFAVQHDKTVEQPTADEIYHTGLLARITEHKESSRGLDIDYEILARVNLLEISQPEDFLQAKISQYDETDDAKQAIELKDQLSGFIAESVTLGHLNSGTKAFLLEFFKQPDLVQATDSIIHYLKLDIIAREQLLEAYPLTARLAAVIKLAGENPSDCWIDPRSKTDPSERMNFAKWLAATENYAEALTEYIWCFDHGLEHNKAFYGVRLSFLLGYMEDLAESYPPARAEMQTRRDALEAKLLNGQATFEEACDYTSLNQHLKDEDHLLAIYDELKSKNLIDEKTAAMMFGHLQDALLKAKRYRDLLTGVDSISEKVAGLLKQCDQMIEGIKRAFSKDPELMEKYMAREINWQRNEAVRESGRIYESLLGEKRVAEAMELAEQMIKFHCNGMTFKIYIWHAGRADAEDIANQLYQQAMQILPPDEKEKVTEYWQKINKE